MTCPQKAAVFFSKLAATARTTALRRLLDATTELGAASARRIGYKLNRNPAATGVGLGLAAGTAATYPVAETIGEARGHREARSSMPALGAAYIDKLAPAGTADQPPQPKAPLD